MRYEYRGISLWYATADAPAPASEVVASGGAVASGLQVTVGVRPIGSRNSVEVRYRVNGGPGVRVTAPLGHTDVHSNAQYFVAPLPDFRVGDAVEFIAILNSAGLQLPVGPDAARFQSAFRVVATPTATTNRPDGTAGNKTASQPAPLSPASLPTSHPSGTAGSSAGAPAPLQPAPPPAPSPHTAAAANAIANELDNHTGSLEEFWQSLPSKPGFQDPHKIAQLQFSLQLGHLAPEQPALVDAIHASGQYRSMRDVALSADQVGAHMASVPDSQLTQMPGATLEAKRAALVQQIQGSLHAAFPTEAVASHLEKPGAAGAAKPQHKAVADFLKRASTPGLLAGHVPFDIATTHVETFCRTHGDKLFQGVNETDRRQIVEDVKRTQRIFRVSTDPASVQALLSAGLDSAHAITRLPKKAFIAQFGAKLGGNDAAALVYDHAASASAVSTALSAHVRTAMSPHRAQATGVAIKQMPGWADMFGGLDLCDCAESDSIYGAPAYLVDLLEFLKSSAANDQGLTPLDYLLGTQPAQGKTRHPGRRPDLAHVLLNAENTETTLPYVDLVNEILESYVVQGAPAASAAHDVDGRTAAQILANPQYVQSAAYDKLSAAVYPPSLPFDRSLESVRLNLAQLSTTRLAVMRAFAADDASQWLPPFVAEVLGISTQEYAILTGQRPDGTVSQVSVRALYGLGGESSLLALGEELQPVRTLMARLEVSYVELLECLKCRFVNPGARELRLVELLELTPEELRTVTSGGTAAVPSPAVQAKLTAAGHSAADLHTWVQTLAANATTVEPESGCDLDDTVVQRRDGQPLDDDTLLQLQRFVRLWRRLGTSAAEADAILGACDYKKDPVRGLQRVAQAREIATQLGLGIGQVAPFWAVIDTFGPKSTYRSLFENRAFNREPDPSFVLAATEDELQAVVKGAPESLSAKAAGVAAAVKVLERDVLSIADASDLTPGTPVNINNISIVHRHVTLARALGLPLRLVLEIKKLAGKDCDPFAAPLNMLRFIRLARLVANAGFTADPLAFLCRHEDSTGAQQARLQSSAAAMSQRLTAASAASTAESKALLLNATSAGLRAKLGEVLETSDLEVAMAIIDGTSKLSAAEQTAFLTAPGRFDLFMDPAKVAAALATPLDSDAAKQEEQQVARRTAILGPLLPFLERRALRSIVADAIGIQDPDLLARLLENAAVLRSSRDAKRGVLDDLLALRGGIADAAGLDAYIRSSKAASLITRFDLKATELDLLLSGLGQSGGLSLNDLASAATDGRSLFRGIRALLDYVALRDGAGWGRDALLQILQAKDDPSTYAAISAASGVISEIVQDAATQLGTSSGVLHSVAGLSTILSLLTLSGASGASPTQLRQLAAPALAETEQLSRELVKSRFDESTYLGVARTVSDALRERQRACLVAYLLTLDSLRSAGVQTADQLFEYFLIDVQMDPCMLTSRIVQAISSVQLFVDRCLLNLEPNIRPSKIDAAQWEWRKNYRVCQANQKVFWHTESYLEPEWRDDRSPFFREVESEILQGDASDAAVEKAFRTYVSKLDEVANLETCGTFFEAKPGDGSRSTLHVAARTRTGSPRKYFYRQWVDAMVWTAWEALEIDISAQEDGDNTGVHLLPFVWRGRTYILWLTFLQRQEKPRYKMVDATKGFTPEDPPKYWEIKLAWSIRENDRWSPKRLTSAKYEYPASDVRQRVLDKIDQLSEHEEKAFDQVKQLDEQVKNQQDALRKLLDSVNGLALLSAHDRQTLLKGMRVPFDQFIAADQAQIRKLCAELSADKRQAQQEKDFGTVGDFHLRAVDLGNTLDVYVTRRNTTTAGRFELSSRNEDFTFALSSYPWDSQLVQGARRDFQTESVLHGGLNLVGVDGGGNAPGSGARNSPTIQLLSSIPGGCRVVSPAQTLGPSLTYPISVETGGGTYFAALKPSVSTVHQVLRNPLLAHPPGLTAAATTHIGGIAQHITSQHPWERASAVAGSQSLTTLAQHNNAMAVIQSHPPPRRASAPTAPAAHAAAGPSQHPTGGQTHVASAHGSAPAGHAPPVVVRPPPASVHTSAAGSHAAAARTVMHPAAKPIVFTPKAPSLTANFVTAFHPYTNEFIKRLNDGGVPELLSMDTQALGNPYFRAPWTRGARVAAAGSAVCVIEGGVGLDSANHRPGDFEAVVWDGTQLAHFRHDSGHPDSAWQRAALIEPHATSGGALCERQSERVMTGQGAAARVAKRGTLDAVVLRKDGLAHYVLLPDAHSWSLQEVICLDAAAAGTIAEVRTARGPAIDVLVPEKVSGSSQLRLAHYRMEAPRAHGANAPWKRLDPLTENTAGAASLIQSSFQTSGQGRLEALVLEGDVDEPDAWQVAHYWLDGTSSSWERGSTLSTRATGPAWLAQGRVQDSSTHTNFEAVVQEDTQLVHFWRDNSLSSGPWHRGRVISAATRGSGCILQGNFGGLGNLEVFLPETSGPAGYGTAGHSIEHYWLAGDGPADSATERFYFKRTHAPDARVVQDPLPRRDIDFTFGSPYSQYNWEIFYHLPILIATRCLRSQRTSVARKWLSYVFNIVDDSLELTSHRYWRCMPLRDEEGERFEQMTAAMRNPSAAGEADRDAIHKQISYWLDHPFMPHRIAQMRTEAYKKFAVTRGTDILLADGDALFSQDSIEAINIATQRYVTARNIHGPRPEKVPRQRGRVAKTYAQLSAAGIDDTGNAPVQLENEFPAVLPGSGDSASGPLAGVIGSSSSAYFCVPTNTKLLEYWDTIDDRLYKIRHCMNIQGVVRQLPLFQPPIDPAALIAAASQGLPLGAALAGLNAPLPNYRFTSILQKAIDACNDAKSLGSMLLSALEKLDSEHIASIRAHHETSSAQRLALAKRQAKAEAQKNLEGLKFNRTSTLQRWRHYQELLGQTTAEPAEPEFSSSVVDGQYKVVARIVPLPQYAPSGRFQLVDMGEDSGVSGDDQPGTKILSFEREEMTNQFKATQATMDSQSAALIAQILHFIPQLEGACKPMGAGMSLNYGGMHLGNAAEVAERHLNMAATISSHNANRAGKLGSFVLREREWAQQYNQAAREVGSIDYQLVSAQIRLDIADRDIAHQEQLATDSKEIEGLLKSKFSNEDLYLWMRDQVQSTHRAHYQMAFELALQAQQCLRFELCLPDAGFISPGGYFDPARNGLLAGEQLHLALRQMQRAYEDANPRGAELSLNASVLALDPLQLVALKETGACEIELTETLFDLKAAGLYGRTIKSLSVSMPCVVGPQSNVSCAVRLLDSVIRIKPTLGSDYVRSADSDDRFIVGQAPAKALILSTGQNDSGLFEPSLRDDRYLPLEGAGAVCRLRLEMMSAVPEFDPASIMDVILHLKYTAKDGGARLSAAAKAAVRKALQAVTGVPGLNSGAGKPLARLFSLRHEFGGEWAALMKPAKSTESEPIRREVTLAIDKSRFPYLVAGAVLQPQSVTLYALHRSGGKLTGLPLTVLTDDDESAGMKLTLRPLPQGLGSALVAKSDEGATLAVIPPVRGKPWTVRVESTKAQWAAAVEEVTDLFLVVTYTAAFGH